MLACQESLREKRNNLQTDLAATRTATRGDAGRLQQVFWNLLSNAIKFTPAEGSITVRTSDATADRIAIEVQDSGAGISEEKLPLIFNMFEQGGTDITARYGGLGLGLTICRGIVSAHEGTITAKSAGAGRGATFIVRLPLLAQITDNSERVYSDADSLH